MRRYHEASVTNGDWSEKPGEPRTPEPPQEPEASETPAESPAPALPETLAPEAGSAAPGGPEAPTPAEAPAAEPFDETADLIRVGQVGSGRRLAPPDADTLRAVRAFASERHLPGLGTLLELARAHTTSGRGPGLGVDVFTEIRGQLGRLVSDVDNIAIHAGPVLFTKTSAKNQPGTALRWLNEEERRALRAHPELLDHPGRLTASLKKLLAADTAPEAADED